MISEENEKSEFDILLDKKEERLNGVETSSHCLYGKIFSSHGYLASIKNLQGAGLLQVPTYLLINGRGFAHPSSPAWCNYIDSLGERLTVKVENKYQDISPGEYVIDIQNGGLFIPRFKTMRNVLKKRKLKKHGAFPISNHDKSLLLGERLVYQFDGNKVQKVPVQIFTSYQEFLEASQDVNFLKNMPVYAVMRPVDEAEKDSFGMGLLGDQLRNPNLIIPAGGKQPLERMLLNWFNSCLEDRKKGKSLEFGWDRFGFNSYMNDLDSGHQVMLHFANHGIYCNLGICSIYNSAGVEREAIDAHEKVLENILVNRVT